MARNKELLNYIEQMRKLSDLPVDEEDLYAAGFDESDLQEAGWFDQQEGLSVPIPQAYPESVAPYEPTMRERANLGLRDFLEGRGWSKHGATHLADGFVGSALSPLGAGVADLTPLGLPMGLQEGARDLKEGWEGGDPARMATGALGVAGSVPGGAMVAKGADVIGSKLLKQHDPNVLRTFFGPESKLADQDKLETAKIMEQEGQTREDIWQKTGWWNSPNGGWKFEVSDHEMGISPSGKVNEEVYQHPSFYEALFPNTEMDGAEFIDRSQEAVSARLGPARYGPRSESPDGSLGSYDPFTRGINLFVEDDVFADPHEVAVHELQHAAQGVEASPGKGTNPGWISKNLSDSLETLPPSYRSFARIAVESSFREKQLEELDKILPNIEARVKRLNAAYLNDESDNPIDALGKYIDAENELTFLQNKRLDLQQDVEFDKKSLAPEELETYLGKVDPEFENILEDLKVMGRSLGKPENLKEDLMVESPFIRPGSFELSPRASFKLYNLEKGEVEARIAGSRAAMTPEERLETAPWKSSDLYEDQEEVTFAMQDLLDWAHALKNYSANKNGYAKGGVVEVDPISGNEVPPGAEPTEVRDDVDAKLSEGEYVIPADVVRYLGLDKIEKLVQQAKDGLAEMDKKGRIGGEEIVEEDDLPFTDEELFASEAPIEMATGGLVQPAGDRIRGGLGLNTQSTLPPWMQDAQQIPQEEQPVQKSRPNEPQSVSKWDKDVSQWSPEQFSQTVTQRNSLGSKVIETGIGKMLPFGGLALRAKNNYINKNAPIAIDKMLKSGMDAQGNPLTDQQKVDLAKAKVDLAATAKNQPGLGGMVMKEVKSIIDPRTPEQKAKAEAEKKAAKEAKEKAAKEKADKDKSEKDKSRDSKSKDKSNSKR